MYLELKNSPTFIDRMAIQYPEIPISLDDRVSVAILLLLEKELIAFHYIIEKEDGRQFQIQEDHTFLYLFLNELKNYKLELDLSNDKNPQKGTTRFNFKLKDQ